MDMWGLGRTGVFTGAQEALPSVGWSWRGREGGKLRVGAGGWNPPPPATATPDANPQGV